MAGTGSGTGTPAGTGQPPISVTLLQGLKEALEHLAAAQDDANVIASNPMEGASINVSVQQTVNGQVTGRMQGTFRSRDCTDWRSLMGQVASWLEYLNETWGGNWSVSGASSGGWSGNTETVAVKSSGRVDGTKSRTVRVPRKVQIDGDSNTYVDFRAESVVVTFDETGTAAYKIKGMPFVKFGVRVWPEILPALGLDAAVLGQKPGTHPFSAVVRAILNDKNQPQKIVGLVPEDETDITVLPTESSAPSTDG